MVKVWKKADRRTAQMRERGLEVAHRSSGLTSGEVSDQFLHSGFTLFFQECRLGVALGGSGKSQRFGRTRGWRLISPPPDPYM